MDLTFDITAIRTKGGLRWAYRRVSDDGSDLIAANSDKIFSVLVTAGGTGYTEGVAITPTGGGGTGFTAIGHVLAGVITSVEVTNPGSGYTSAPTLAASGGTGATFTAQFSDSWHDGVYRKSSEIGFDQPLETEELESGDESLPDFGKFASTFNIESAQDDANLVKFLKNEVQNYVFAIFIERGKGAGNTKMQYFFGITKIARSYNSKAPGRKPQISIKYSYNDAAITPAELPTWAIGTAADFTIGVGEYFDVENL